jgi:hypothetical protein
MLEAIFLDSRSGDLDAHCFERLLKWLARILRKIIIANNTKVCIIVCMVFEWNDAKEIENISKHGISFYEAQYAFADDYKLIVMDKQHSKSEKRYFCIGKLDNGRVVTMRFTKRNTIIRIIGAGYWRKGKKIYEKRTIQ